MKFKAYFIVILVNMVVGYMLFFYSQVDHHENELKWDRERDSLTTALDTANARTMRSEGRANHIAWQLDSARKNRPTPKQVIEHNLKAMKYAPLDAVHDTLMMP